MSKRERNRFVPGEIRVSDCHFCQKLAVSDKRGVNGLGSKVKRHNTLSHSCLCLGTESDFDQVRRSETCTTDATSRVQAKKEFEPCRLRGFRIIKLLVPLAFL